MSLLFAHDREVATPDSSIAPTKGGGLEGGSVIKLSTEPEPADSPAMTILSGEPLKAAILDATQLKAIR